MKSYGITPRRVLWTGLILAIGGALLTYVFPLLQFMSYSNPPTGIGMDLLNIATITIQIAKEVLIQIGAALIGASIVIKYLDLKIFKTSNTGTNRILPSQDHSE
ncbi:MAG: hypothetical protein IT191_05910 [Microbacteriaceae bacterium]|nr:hypothetical protein [Cryobacterium sp.]MBX3103894.1 hypothetical protein [Cryobacterium sp.]MCC6376537.1 hypothetical protein [Microbacteriaceae bacterium]